MVDQVRYTTAVYHHSNNLLINYVNFDLLRIFEGELIHWYTSKKMQLVLMLQNEFMSVRVSVCMCQVCV